MPSFLEKLFGRKPAEPARPRVNDADATHPLPPAAERLASPTAPTQPTPLKILSPRRITLGVAQDVGRVRSHNEDVLLIFNGELAGLEAMPSLGLVVVADGMGGHSLGERASAVAARTVANSVLTKILPSLLADPQTDPERPMLNEVMDEAVCAANTAVLAAVPEGGTTITCALVIGEQVVISHVGDSRAYALVGDTFEQLTRDHSLVQRLKELNQISAEEAAVHPQRSVLYRAVGQGEGLEVDVTTTRLPPGSTMLLCSDGLWSMIGDDKILATIQQAPDLQTASEGLVAAANAAGGQDNITAVLLRLPG